MRKIFIKGRSERRPDRTSPAMRVGLTERPWTWRRVFSRRVDEYLGTPGLPVLRRAHAG